MPMETAAPGMRTTKTLAETTMIATSLHPLNAVVVEVDSQETVIEEMVNVLMILMQEI